MPPKGEGKGRVDLLLIRKRDGGGDARGGEGDRPAEVLSEPERAEDVPIPPALDTPEFRKAWFADWLPWRRSENHQSVTPTGARRSLAALEKYGSTVAVQAIEASIANDWRGLFPDRVSEAKKADEPLSYDQLRDRMEQKRWR